MLLLVKIFQGEKGCCYDQLRFSPLLPGFRVLWGGGEIKIVHPAKPGKTGNPEKILDAKLFSLKKPKFKHINCRGGNTNVFIDSEHS